MKTWKGEPVAPEMLEQILRLEAMPDSDIDFSDMPEVTDWSGEAARRTFATAKM